MSTFSTPPDFSQESAGMLPFGTGVFSVISRKTVDTLSTYIWERSSRFINVYSRRLLSMTGGFLHLYCLFSKSSDFHPPEGYDIPIVHFRSHSLIKQKGDYTFNRGIVHESLILSKITFVHMQNRKLIKEI